MGNYSVLTALDETQRRELISHLTRTFSWFIGKCPKTTSDLFDVINRTYKKLPCILEEFEQLLYFIGWSKTEDTRQVQLITNVDTIPDDTSIVAAYLKFENHLPTKQKLMAKYQHLTFKKTVLKETHEEDIATHIADNEEQLAFFYTTWCVSSREKSILKGIDTKYWRCPFKTLYDTYCEFCLTMKFKPLSKKELLVFFDSKGHKRSKGYANGVSGTSFFYGLYVPGCGSVIEVTFSKRFNQCVILANRRLYTKQGQLVADLEDEVVESTVSSLDRAEIGTNNSEVDKDEKTTSDLPKDKATVALDRDQNDRQIVDVSSEEGNRSSAGYLEMTDDEFANYILEYVKTADGINNLGEKIEYMKYQREKRKTTVTCAGSENGAACAVKPSWCAEEQCIHGASVDDIPVDKDVSDVPGEIDPETEKILQRYNLQDYGK